MKSNNRIRKQIISISLVWLLFFSVFLVYPLPIEQQVCGSFTGEDATPPVNGDWVIDSPGNIVINETITLNGNLTILNGGSLTFKNVTLLMNCKSNGTYNIEVENGGAFYIYDYDNEPLTKGDASIITSATPDCNHRFYIHVKFGAKFEMKNSELHECGYVSYEPTEYWTKGLCIETNNTLIENCIITNNYRGLMLYYYSSDSLVLNCIISNNLSDGLRMSGFTLGNHIVNNIIKNCIIASNGKRGTGDLGILITYTDGSVIDNCSIYQNPIGIKTGETNGVDILNCNIINNNYGIFDAGANLGTIINYNSIIGNLEYAIYSYYNSPLNAQNNYFGTKEPIQIKDFIYGSNVDYSNWLNYRESNILHVNNTEEWKNTVKFLNNGLIVNGNLTVKNTKLIMNNSYGKNFIQVNGKLYIENSTIDFNQTNSKITSVWGIYTFLYCYNSLGYINNSEFQGQKGICIRNNFMNISNTTIYGNLISSKYYLYGFLIKGDNTTIEHCNVSDICYGIQINSKNNTIRNCNLFSNAFGIMLEGNNNTIINCNISNNGGGIWLRGGDFNNITRSNISNNQWGIFFQVSMNNFITNCNISFNDREGVFISITFPSFPPSMFNKIYHNNFISNGLKNHPSFQACDMGVANEWHNGYPSGGNYWDDYEGTDFYHGESQNLTGSDGIGDTHYEGNGTAIDYYPLMEMNGICYLRLWAPVLNKLASPDPNGTYNLSWSSVINATNYTVEESEDLNFQSIINAYNCTKTYKNIISQDNGTYYYRVNASNNKYISPWSNIESIIVDYPPDIPRNITVTQIQEGNALNISWKLNQIDTINYSLWSNKTGDWKFLINITHPNNSHIDTGLIDGVIYYYKLKSWDGIGQYSGFSNVISNKSWDSILPAIPTGLKAITISNNSINLTWNPNIESDLVGYDIYRSEFDNNSYEKINDVPIIKNVYIDTNLTENTTYYYKIKAFDEVPNYSNFSDEAFNTTRPILPYITSYSPFGANVPIDTNITITFSKSMNDMSVESAFSITPLVEGKFSWTENNHTLLFDPFEDLKEQETYNVTISNSAVDLRNNSLDHPFSWEFVTLNIISPKIISYFPKGTHIPIDTDISVTFSVEMNKSSVESAFSIIPITDGVFHWSKDNMTLIFDPEMNLFELTVYEISINISAADLFGNSLISIFNWNFTTGNFTSPGIILYSPIGNDIPVGTNISITFNVVMNKTSVIDSFSITNNVEGEFYWNGNTLIFEPGANLEYDSKYTVTITVLAKDNWGNHIKANFTWEFTTEKKEDQEASQDKIDAESIYIGIFLIILIIIIVLLIWIKVKSFKANNKVEEKEAADNEIEE